MFHTHSARLQAMRKRVAVLGALVVLVQFAIVATSPIAGAYCVGLASAQVLSLSWGREHTPNSATCDQDQIYQGKVTDLATDGYCVSVQFQEGSTVYTQGTSCNSSGLNYTFWDQNGNGWSNIRICKQGTSTCSSWTYTHGY